MTPSFFHATTIAAVTLLLHTPSGAAASPSPVTAEDRLAALERAAAGRLGVAAIDTASEARIMYRADERFPFCSTFKVILVSAILDRSASEGHLLDRTITYAKGDLVTYSPITENHAGHGMTVSQLCAAALQYSDNTAANLLIGRLGGPAAVTAFARSIGDTRFRLDRIETELNEATPGDPRDTTTPAAMAKSLRQLTLGDALSRPARHRLTEWMRGNTTGASRIRAGVPPGWSVADKTGTGDYGSTNDIGLVWPPGESPIVLAVYFTQPDKDAKPRNDVIAEATRIVTDALAGDDAP